MSLFFSTCSLISSSVSVITGMKQINAKVATMLQPHKGLRVCEMDRRRLVAIHRRVECLIQPLNFCVMWSKDRDSCIQPIIHYAYELVQGVTDFLDKVKFTTDDLDPFCRVLEKESSVKVDHFLRELEFACTGVSMAVSIARGIGMSMSSESSFVSPSALLKASTQIVEMASRSGDLFAVNGLLFRKDDSEWSLLSDDCVFRVSQFKSVDPSDSPYLIRLSDSKLPVAVNLNFPIQTALSFRVSTNSEVGINLNAVIDSTVIVWEVSEAASEKKRFLHRNPSGDVNDLSRLSLDSSDDEAVVVHGAADMPGCLRPRISSTHISSDPAARYAFLMANSSSLSPLDLVYISRLCVMEAVRTHAIPSADSSSSPRSTSVRAAVHLEASDEALVALLSDAKFSPQPPPKVDLQLIVDDT